MSPLRYQKWLRLNEVRRPMLNEHYDVTTAAYAVGYESYPISVGNIRGLLLLTRIPLQIMLNWMKPWSLSSQLTVLLPEQHLMHKSAGKY